MRKFQCWVWLVFTGTILFFSFYTWAAGPTGALNDTGQTKCYDSTVLAACSSQNSGDPSSYPRQDGRFGRDPAAGNLVASGFSKPAGSGGNGGFAFTPLDVGGIPISLTGNPPVPSSTPRCIWDRVTNLIWEVKTDNASPDLQDKDWTYAWGANSGGSNCLAGNNCNTNNYVTAINAINLCGETIDDWRLPTRRELLSIVDHGSTVSLAIDSNYFPNTAGLHTWTSSVYAPSPGNYWFINFSAGNANKQGGGNNYRVRLVRNGP